MIGSFCKHMSLFACLVITHSYAVIADDRKTQLPNVMLVQNEALV